MRISKKIIDYYKAKIPSEECKMTERQFAVLKKIMTRNESESFETMAKSFKMEVVHFNSAAMVALFKIRKFLEKEDFNKNQIEKMINLIFK